MLEKTKIEAEKLGDLKADDTTHKETSYGRAFDGVS